MKKTKLYIDAFPLVHEHFSGVGTSLLYTVRALEDLQRERGDFEVVLCAPYRMLHRLNRWGFQSLEFKAIPLPRRVLMGLQRRNLLPPLDLILGKGVYFFPNFLNWRLVRSKSITLIHDISFELYPQFVDPPNRKFLSTNVPISVHRSDIVASVSPNARKDVIDFYKVPADKAYVLPNGVDRKEFYRRTDEEVARIKAKYGVVGDYFVFISNIEPRKNLLNLLKAYRSLPKHITDKYGLLLIGGGGWQDGEIQKAMAQARYDGYRILRPYSYVLDEDKPAMISGAVAMVYPSYYEGFGIPPLEAMACGCPVVTSNCSSLPWVVGKAAILVEPDDVSSIAEGMREVVENDKKRQELIEAGLEQVKKFTWETSARVIIDEIIPKLTSKKGER